MIYGYARVSSLGQKDGNSLEAQEKMLRENGATIVFKDVFTGTKIDRPELDKLLEVLESGDTLIVAKLDRISRSVEGGIKLVNELVEKGVAINILNMGMIDDTATGKLIRNIFFAFAEYERDLIAVRCKEGRDIARQRADYKEGRPQKFDNDTLEYALKLLEKKSYTEVSRITGISKSTLIRAKKRLN